MDSVFASLTAGIRFNKNKCGNAVKIFTKDETARESVNILDVIGGKTSSSKKSSITNPKSSSSSESELADTSSKKRKFERIDEINEFRNRLAIKVKGQDVPAPAPSFYDMNIADTIRSTILSNIEKSDWKEPTPIQMQAIPALLQGRDVLAAAPTGSGKTAAFVIPILSMLGRRKPEAPSSSRPTHSVSSVILAPTKELAEQIHREVLRLSTGKKLKIMLLNMKTASMVSKKQDKSALGHVDVLVSTPLRLLSLIRARCVDLAAVQMVVLDEADKLFEFDMLHDRSSADTTGDEDNEDEEEEEQNGDGKQSSFLNQVDEILNECSHEGLHRALFSATIGPMVQTLANSFLVNPVQITIGVENAGASTIDQKLVFVGREDSKLLSMRQLIQQGITPPVLVFVQSKDRAKELFLELVYDGIHVDVIHADRTEQQREEVIKQFRLGNIWVLICTDLMARGVDFKGVQMVINYDFPTSAVQYIHRIGRTGRAGRAGSAVTFFTEADLPRLRSIANVMKLSGCQIPDWILSIKKMSTREKRRLRQSAPVRRNINTEAAYMRKERLHKKQIVEQSKAKKLRRPSGETEASEA